MDRRKEVDRILLSKYSPASAVVDENLEVVEIRGSVSPYLTLPVGKTSLHLVKLVPDTGLFLEVEKLIGQAWKDGEPAVEEHYVYAHSGITSHLRVEVVPLDSGRDRSALVLFQPGSDPAEAEAMLPDESPGVDLRDVQISRLKRQLANAKERFLSVMEAHQTSREESQNTTGSALHQRGTAEPERGVGNH